MAATNEGFSATRFERFLGNLSQMMIRLAGYAVGLVAVHRFIGLPVGFNW